MLANLEKQLPLQAALQDADSQWRGRTKDTALSINPKSLDPAAAPTTGAAATPTTSAAAATTAAAIITVSEAEEW